MNYPIISTGIDPDIHNCAVAHIFEYSDGSHELKVEIVRQKEGKRREAAVFVAKCEELNQAVNCRCPTIVTVEGQDVRYTGRTTHANPQDVLNLALITGAVLALSTAEATYSPLPREWKGNVRKDIKQKRILKELGIEYVMMGGKSPYPVPLNRSVYEEGKVNAGDWKDLADAVGLALWGLEKYKKERGV